MARGVRPTDSRWTPVEDDLLRMAIEKIGPRTWRAVSRCVGTRTAKQVAPAPSTLFSFCRDPSRACAQCRHRWATQLNPTLSHAPFTEREDAIIVETRQKLLREGSRKMWSQIASVLPGRSDNAIKNRYATLRKRESLTDVLDLPIDLSDFSSSDLQALDLSPLDLADLSMHLTGSAGCSPRTARAPASKRMRAETPIAPHGLAQEAHSSVGSVDCRDPSPVSTPKRIRTVTRIPPRPDVRTERLVLTPGPLHLHQTTLTQRFASTGTRWVGRSWGKK